MPDGTPHILSSTHAIDALPELRVALFEAPDDSPRAAALAHAIHCIEVRARSPLGGLDGMQDPVRSAMEVEETLLVALDLISRKLTAMAAGISAEDTADRRVRTEPAYDGPIPADVLSSPLDRIAQRLAEGRNRVRQFRDLTASATRQDGAARRTVRAMAQKELCFAIGDYVGALHIAADEQHRRARGARNAA